MKNENENYRTNDLCLASFLLAKNVPFVGINKDSSGRADFIFCNSKDCQKLVREFTSLVALVEPMSFFDAQKKLKHLIYLWN